MIFVALAMQDRLRGVLSVDRVRGRQFAEQETRSCGAYLAHVLASFAETGHAVALKANCGGALRMAKVAVAHAVKGNLAAGVLIYKAFDGGKP